MSNKSSILPVFLLQGFFILAHQKYVKENLLGFLFNNLTMISPNMLTAVGIADAIHLVASWMVIRRRADTKHAAILETMRRNAVPVLLTSVTTAIGFFSLTVSGLAPVRMLGIMAGIGALVALVLSLTIVPAVLSLVPHRPGGDARVAGAGLFDRGRAERFVAFIVSKRAPILAITAALALVAVYGVSRVRIDTDFRAMFPDDNEKIADFQWIEDQLGGVGDLEIVFDGTRGEVRAPELTREERARLDELRLLPSTQLGVARFEVHGALEVGGDSHGALYRNPFADPLAAHELKPGLAATTKEGPT